MKVNFVTVAGLQKSISKSEIESNHWALHRRDMRAFMRRAALWRNPATAARLQRMTLV